MDHHDLSAKIAKFDTLMSTLGFAWPRRSPVQAQMDLVKEYLTDLRASQADAATKWAARDFLSWYRAMIAVEMLCESALELSAFPPDLLRKQLELATMSDLSQDFEQSQAKEYLYELQVAALLHRSGFTVTFAEPDLRVRGNGLSCELGVACKYVSSEKKLNDNISKGYDQISKQGLSGIVAVGMDNVVAAGMDKFIDFPDDLAELRKSMSGVLGDWIRRTLKGRAGVPGRVPLDGAMFTLRMVGLWGAPKRLVSALHVSFQVDEGNPIRGDIERVMAEYIRSHRTVLG